MSERQIELTWKCSSCAHKNLGRHTICQGCGNPKDGSEEYEMPADPSQVATVTDPALLRMAKAGANWSCAYCGSDQRALDGGCARCGAGRGEGANAVELAAGVAPQAPRVHRAWRGSRTAAIAGAAIIALGIGTCAIATRRHPAPADPWAVQQPTATTAIVIPPPRTEFVGTVTSVSWQRTTTIETWQLAPHDGFTSEVPEDALAITPAGQHVHHYDDVLDHDETEYDDVEVPDGYRTETYTERVSCGQDCTTSPRICTPSCTTTPRTCSQSCTNNKNGFATCTTNCTGGTQSCTTNCTGGTSTCTTRYCNETRTRQIPKTRHERRPRIVHKYRKEPRYAAWSTYKTWEWIATSHADEMGNDISPKWPDAGAVVQKDASAPKSGDRREIHKETLSATITTDDGASHSYVPADENELARLAPGSTHKVRVGDGKVTLLD
jgi:hypothetical protein